MRLRTPLAKVRGLGSAKEGSRIWWAQRLTSLALIPLSLWFICSLVSMTTMDYMAAIGWLQSPIICVFMILFVISLFYHAQLGMQVVFEDYIGNEAVKIASIIILQFVMLFSGLASIIAILKVFLGL